jgi:hypothetical protein
VRNFILRMRRARHVVAPPLNCGVMRHFSRSVRSGSAAGFTAFALVVAAQEPICNPCVDGPEMFEQRRSEPPSSRSPSSPRAQAAGPFSECPANLRPTVEPPPDFPAYGNWALSVTIRFFVDTDGRVVVPSVWDARWTLESRTEKIPQSFKSAIVDAVSRWRFPPRSTPCASNISRTFSNVL